MHQRVNISLPQGTLRIVDRIVGKGGRSRLINEAVCAYVAKRTRTKLRRLITEGAKRHAARDLEIAEEWFPLEEEAWQSGDR